MASHEVWLSRDDGTPLTLLDQLVSLEYALVVNGIGACVVTLPHGIDLRLLVPDRQLAIWRTPTDGARRLERIYFVRRIRDVVNTEGMRQVVLTGYDSNYLLSGRIVAYAAGSSQAEKTAAVDDMMKAVVRENLGASATDTARRLNSSFFGVAADAGLGPSVTKAFSRRNVFEVLTDLANVAWQAGTDVFFDIVPTTPKTFEFQTFTGQRGLDRRYPGTVNPVLLGAEFGNLAEPELSQDYGDEVTFVYGAGQGEGSTRVTSNVEDVPRSGRSIWGRREAMADARNEATTAGVTAAANRRLAEGRPNLRFSGKIVDGPSLRYGRDWWWGDRVSAMHAGRQYDAHIRAVRVSVDSNGMETVEAHIEAYE